MEQQSPILTIITDESERQTGTRLANLLGYSFSHIVVGDGHDAARFIEANHINPTYILMIIGNRREAVYEELNSLAQHCVAGTQIVIAGETNDIHFYRSLIDRGVADYFPLPVNIDQVSQTLSRQGKSAGTQNSSVISFMSAAAGDGSSTVALNVGYSLSKDFNAKTIIVDMDYQFGMTAKNLDLSSPYGIKELFDHPDRGIDMTLVERMVVGYNNNLDIIASPNELKFMPDIRPEIIRDLLFALQEKYQYVIIDLPHIWSPWIASAFNHSNAIMLVAQLWLKSVTHASRLLNVWRETGVNLNQSHVIINRSGAKYKEGISTRDFERVCNKPISFYLPNDIKTVVNAENMGKTILELGKTKLSTEIQQVAATLRNMKDGSGSVLPANTARLPFASSIAKLTG